MWRARLSASWAIVGVTSPKLWDVLSHFLNTLDGLHNRGLLFLCFLLALLVGLVWAIGNLLAIDVVRVMGGLAFNRWRMTIVGTGLLVIALLAGSFEGLKTQKLGALLLSGLVGIFLAIPCFLRRWHA